jgi:hypothetical protein
MASTGLYGPFPLTTTSIDENAAGIAPGAYALGTKNKEGGFSVSYVGRSDDDLNGRLKQHVGEYTHFKHAFYKTSKEAFAKECILYHDFSPPDNQVHPAKPTGTKYQCPVSGCEN